MTIDCEVHDEAVMEVGRLQRRIAELEALVSSMHENGRRITFDVETYIGGIRFSTGDYQIMRIGPPADRNPPF